MKGEDIKQAIIFADDVVLIARREDGGGTKNRM